MTQLMNEMLESLKKSKVIRVTLKAGEQVRRWDFIESKKSRDKDKHVITFRTIIHD